MARTAASIYKISLGFAAGWVTAVAFQSYGFYNLGFSYHDAVLDAVASQFVLAATGYAFMSSLRFYQPGRKNAWYATSASIVLAVICTLAQHSLLQQLLPGNLSYQTAVDNSLWFRGLFNWLTLVIIGILCWFWVYVSEQLGAEKQNEDAARLAREAELSNLRTQLQPHFLFNSLNSISALVLTQPGKARDMIQQLSDFLRGTIKREDRERIMLSEELQHLQLYLEIEKVRFGHRLTTTIRQEELTSELMLPPLVLQPIVENAIKFGLYDTIGEITITLEARVENNDLLLEVSNPFDPDTAQPPRGTGFGLNSVRRRLYLLYFRNDLLSTRQENQTFITTIKIPQLV